MLEAGFDVTVISRPGGQKYKPPDSANTKPVTTLEAAYDDVSSLTAALQDQDALVETYNPASTVHQRTIVRAALAAGVKHLITNEFDVNSFAPNAAKLPATLGKIEAQHALEEELQAAIANGKPASLAWTGIIAGVWFDWAIRLGQETFFWVNPTKRSIIHYGSGNQRTCLSHVAATGDAVVTVLHEPERFRNRPAYSASYTVTTNEVVSMIKEISGESGKPWDIVEIPDMEAFKLESLRLWDEDKKNGVDNMMHTQGFLMQVLAGFFAEKNYYGFDFGEKVEPGWNQGHEKLKEQITHLIEEVSN